MSLGLRQIETQFRELDAKTGRTNRYYDRTKIYRNKRNFKFSDRFNSMKFWNVLSDGGEESSKRSKKNKKKKNSSRGSNKKNMKGDIEKKDEEEGDDDNLKKVKIVNLKKEGKSFHEREESKISYTTSTSTMGNSKFQKEMDLIEEDFEKKKKQQMLKYKRKKKLLMNGKESKDENTLMKSKYVKMNIKINRDDVGKTAKRKKRGLMACVEQMSQIALKEINDEIMKRRKILENRRRKENNNIFLDN